MNINLAVVGGYRVGKTMFCINFAEYLGAKTLCYTEIGPHRKGRGVISPREARELMVHPGPHSNGVVRTFAVHLMRRPGLRLAFMDTASLKGGVSLNHGERCKLILTLQALEESCAVIYLIDLTVEDPAALEFWSMLHSRLYEYCKGSGKPLITAGSKWDLLEGLPPSLEQFHPHYYTLVPVSSLTGAGFSQLWLRIDRGR